MKKKIMIVDDALFMRKRLKTVLEELNCEFLEAENGEVACELFQKEQPDLILMDISMPVMDGIDALIAIRKMDAQVPVVICSAIGQETMIVRAINAGASEFIVKPFTSENILKTARKYLGVLED